MASPRGLPESDLSNAEKGASEKIAIPVKPLPTKSTIWEKGKFNS
jgi:hypothetical protein